MDYVTEEHVVSGVKVFVRRSGKGSPVLFLHGAAGITEWSPFFQNLSETREVWVPDHPGYGLSDDPKWIRNLSDLSMFYLDLIETIGPEVGFHLVGHSLGGWLAAEIAIRNLKGINRISLISPSGLRLKGVPRGDYFIWNAEERARNFVYSNSLQESMLSATLADDQIDIDIKNKQSTAKFAWQPRSFNPDLEKWLHRVKVPVQIIWGANDKVIPVAYGDLWKRSLVGSELFILRECGHLPTIEQPDELLKIITGFEETAS